MNTCSVALRATLILVRSSLYARVGTHQPVRTITVVLPSQRNGVLFDVLRYISGLFNRRVPFIDLRDRRLRIMHPEHAAVLAHPGRRTPIVAPPSLELLNDGE